MEYETEVVKMINKINRNYSDMEKWIVTKISDYTRAVFL